MTGRFIANNTQTTHLLQAIQEEDENEYTAFVGLDQEKAFDRVSWRTLNETFTHLGFGPNLCRWIRSIYNIDCPLRRRIRIGAEYSDWYYIKCAPKSPAWVYDRVNRSIYNNVAGVINRLINKGMNKGRNICRDPRLLLRKRP